MNRVIVVAAIIALASMLTWLPRAGDSQQQSELYEGIPMDATLLHLDKRALDEAYHQQLLALFGVWIRQQAGIVEAEKMRNGLRVARRAYNTAAAQIAKREAELLQIDRERQEKPDGPSPHP